MARKHYHVIENTPGYLPELAGGELFTNKREARKHMTLLADELLLTAALMGELDTTRAIGSAKSGLIRVESSEPHDLGRVIELIECTDSDCLEPEYGY